MVVTRKSNQREPCETRGENRDSPERFVSSILADPPQLSFVFRPPTSSNTGEEFDIGEDDSARGSEPKESASQMTLPADDGLGWRPSFLGRDESPAPSQGGGSQHSHQGGATANSAGPGGGGGGGGSSEVVRLLGSLHDLSRQMEVTMEDLRAQLGNRLGADYQYNSGDYESMTSSLNFEDVTRQRIQRMKGVVTSTCAGIASRLALLWRLMLLHLPGAPAVKRKAEEMYRLARPYLHYVVYILVAYLAYAVYQTHRRLTKQRQQIIPGLY